MMAQFLFKFCFALFLIKSALAFPSPYTSGSADLSIPPESISTPPKEPPAKFPLLPPRNDTEHLAQYTNSNTDPQSQNDINIHTKRGYAKGTCWAHLWVSQTCSRSKHQLYTRLNLKDKRGKLIAAPRNSANGGKGMRIDQRFYGLTSELPYVFLIKGHDNDDYVEFKYARFSWTSKTKEGNAYCKTGAYDPKPYWGPCHYSPETRVRQMDCYFPC